MDGDCSAQPSILRVEDGEGGAVLRLTGRLDDGTVAACWNEALSAVSCAPGAVEIDCHGVDYCGGAGFALLAALEEAARTRGASLQLQGLAPRFREIYDTVDREKLHAAPAPPRGHGGRVAEVGYVAAERAADWRAETEFVGETLAGLWALARHPRRLRIREWWKIVEKAGGDALPIVGLISFLTGVIIAFQAAMPMRQFGVDIFVVNLVALAITRELGPIMTAIVLAGRTGSAFAAEIGTMKVNEEVAALTTMGLNPVRFLAVPRVLAGIVVTPLLTIYSMAAGIAGGLVVMMLIDFPLSTLMNQLSGALKLQDIAAGLIKSFFFGAVVAGVGCLRGLRTGAGPAAVGDATTRAVVTGIFLIVVLDAIFAVVYYNIDF
jgi:phospholipid/cholesterol/gamma-HCH transport system permease protein